jgi:uncharacterized lipoprotein NlpE involved in copper resistance
LGSAGRHPERGTTIRKAGFSLMVLGAVRILCALAGNAEERRCTMKKRVVVTLMLCVFLLVLGCNPKAGLIVLDTRPQGAAVYLNEEKVGETPVTFEFDMEKPVTLKILKEGYQPKEEKLNVGWVKSEYHLGNYSKGEYMIKGTKQKGFEVHTIRDLTRSEEN